MKYAFVEYGGQVLGIETRCSCFYRKDKKDGELAVEDIIHPDLVHRYVEIPEGTVCEEGMIYSDGVFKNKDTYTEYTLDTYKKTRIDESNNLLDQYLKEHPMPSDVHGGKTAYYSVTTDKQALLNSNLMLASNAAATGLEYEVAWNATGEECEPWTLEELTTLSYQIAAYVKPFVTEQRKIEKAINACETFDETKNVAIDYANCPYSK